MHVKPGDKVIALSSSKHKLFVRGNVYEVTTEQAYIRTFGTYPETDLLIPVVNERGQIDGFPEEFLRLQR